MDLQIFERNLLCSARLYLFDQKYSENSIHNTVVLWNISFLLLLLFNNTKNKIFEIEIFCQIINAFSNFDQFNAALLNKSIDFVKNLVELKHLNSSVYVCMLLYIHTNIYTDKHIQYLTEVSTPVTFLYIFYYIFSCDNTEEMTLCYNVK